MTPDVFLTGFPGFLGRALIERLLARGETVACLVQPQFGERATREAAALARAADRPTDAVAIHEGDITEPDLGLDDAGRTVAQGAGQWYHLAAVYDLGVSRAVGRAVNVEGTAHVAERALRAGVDRFHYVSTCYVSGRYDGVFGPDDLDVGQSFNNHYEATKFGAELRVREAMGDGLPATVYRPSIVVGDSETGATGKYDGFYYLLRLLAAGHPRLTPTFAVPGARRSEFNLVPRNYVVDAIDHLSTRPEAVGETYQLCDPAPETVARVAELTAGALGHRLLAVPAPLRVVKPAMRALAAAGVPIEPESANYLTHPTRYVAPNARRALAGTGIDCPPFAAYVEALVAFYRANRDVAATGTY